MILIAFHARRRLSALLLPLLSLLVMPATSADAETSDWASNEGGRMRIVALAPDARGIVRGGLQIEPKAGWITYWREPGDAGIPPNLSFAEGSGVSLKQMAFPVPRKFENGDIRDIGYDGPVTFPFELSIDRDGKPARPVTASAFIGICRNICIPFQADFQLSLKSDAGTSLAEAMVLNEADARLPEKPSADFAVTHYVVSADGDTLRLTLKLPAGAPKKPKVIVTGPEGHVLFNDEDGTRQADSYSIDMPVGKLPKEYDMKGKRWGILVLAGKRAMETSLAFE